MEKINGQIKILRESRGLTYEQFGERIQVEGSRVLMWEDGTSLPTMFETRAICREFKTNVRWLVAGMGEMDGYSADAIEEVEDMIAEEMVCIMGKDEI